MYKLFSGIFLGWALGANDSANVFGTAVSSRMIKYSTAIVLTSIFVFLGAFFQGSHGLDTLKNLSVQTTETAYISSLAAALTVTIMTILKLPISTSQAVVGSIIGIGLMRQNVNTTGLTKVIICWLGTPIGGFIFSYIFYSIFLFLFKKFRFNIFVSDSVLRIGLILAGCYGSYALGANNVANVTGVYVGNLLSVKNAIYLGAFSICLGTITYSKNVMYTIGKSIVTLDAFSAFVAVFSHSITVHLYAIIGVPVSTSQAIVGSILAIGFIKGVQTINFITLIKICAAWFFTPILGLLFSIILYFIIHLKFVPS